ncbi:LAFA_0E11034g1_1 [Lachancea sp. 'fantastica']|nr:LAFA_0E11034g1_1 [Lachancea sp. 'fantastica']
MRIGLNIFRRNVYSSKVFKVANSEALGASLSPSEEEVRIIDDLPFFRKCSLRPESGGTKSRKAYLDRKLPKVRKLFRNEQNPAFLSYDLPKELPNPYLDAQARAKINPVNGTTEYAGTARLSVTKLLTKRWCELREAYDIYSQVPIYEHGQVSVGRREHQRLEDEAHVTPSNAEILKEELTAEIPQDAVHTLAENWFQTIIRLLALFQTGQAREILCHGYLSSKDCALDGNVAEEDAVLVSGIIDHLLLKRRNTAELKPTSLLAGNCSEHDLQRIVHDLNAAVRNSNEELEIIVSDVKTRSSRTIPQQTSVVKASKIQVMYYRYFLEELSKDVAQTYERLLMNARKRGIDLDAPINAAKLVVLMETSPVIARDMQRLQKGFPIGFAPFDDFHESSMTSRCEYDLESFQGVIENADTHERYYEYFTKWKTPLTLRYFAARLAQMYNHVGPLLSKNLMIEYYSGSTNFHSISFEYDPEDIKHHSTQSALFWFGKRKIEPIKPTVRNMLTYCKYCDYEQICLWRKQGSDMCKGLGKELQALHPNESVVQTN